MALPDILTYLRLLSIPLVVVLFHTPLPPSCAPFTNHHLVSFIYALASYTDYLDGYLARRWSIASPFGAFLDPVADKLMVSTTLILLSGLYGTIVSVPTSLIIAREISVSALREWMSGKGLRDVVKVGWSGKAKTAVTMVASTILLAVKPTGRGEIEEKVFKAAMAGIYLSALLTVTSGWGYFDAAKGELMQGRKIGR
ncbi:hypothetical protein TrCOL_g5949 [Triparma columacea]|uniref:CDP-diacylglycerol--glycerol-3-phosphate 3-phosphatidyltransferase n=1 Tax=Triparma columacea TaxID=722753 RepID=A0A9W7GKE2_9STRA|nr:hypothetical protein TrCOL_g5949 [Triparma columacea]